MLFTHYQILKKEKMTESTDFSTSLKGLSKVAYFTIFYMTVTESTFKTFLKILFLHSSSQQGQQREHSKVNVLSWIRSQAPRVKRSEFGV